MNATLFIVEHKLNTSLFNLCSTEQKCIYIGITCYKISILDPTLLLNILVSPIKLNFNTQVLFHISIDPCLFLCTSLHHVIPLAQYKYPVLHQKSYVVTGFSFLGRLGSQSSNMIFFNSSKISYCGCFFFHILKTKSDLLYILESVD